MKIYIPKHLRNLKLVDNMARMIEEYSKLSNSFQSDLDSFGNYYENLAEDPVEKFIRLTFTEEKFNKSIQNYNRSTTSTFIPSGNFTIKDQKYEEVVKYLTKLFYSVKGTPKVGEYLKKYLVDTEDISYDGSKLKIYIETIELDDESEWSSAFEGFVNSLLYFNRLDLDMKQVTLEVKDKLENNLGTSLICYREFNVQEIL